MKLTVFLLSYHSRQEMNQLSSILEEVPHCFISNISQATLPAKILFVQNCSHSPLQSKFLAQLEEEGVDLDQSIAGFFWQGAGREELLNLCTQVNRHGCGLLSQPIISHKRELPLIAERLLGLGFRGYLPRNLQAPRLLVVSPQFVAESPYPQVSNTFDLWEELHRRLAPFVETNYLDLSLNSPLFPFFGANLGQESLMQLATADAVLLLCPSFYGSISPLLLGFLQKLAQLPLPFQDKAVFGILVTEQATGDVATAQLLSLLSLENSFYLPPRFLLSQSATQASECLARPLLDEELDRFSGQILELLSQGSLA